MKKWSTLILTFLSVLPFWAHAQVVGEGRFYAANDDSLTFVKTQLHYQAVRDVITKEMKTLGLDEKVFWENYETRFGEYFAPHAQEIHDKFSVNGEIAANKKADYDKALRNKRLSLLSRFGRLQGLVSSYSVKRMTRSPQAPQSRYYEIEARIDRRALNDLYLKFTSTDSDRQYQTLFVTTDFRLRNMSWNDTGVDVGSSFTDVIKNHWRKWLETKYAGIVQEIVFTDESSERHLRDFLLIPRDVAFNQRIEEGDSSIARYASGLWLKLGTDIEKISDDSLLEKREISVEGEMLLIELKTNQSIAQADLAKEAKLFYTDNINNFSSSLASMVYSKPLPELENAKRALSNTSLAQQDYHINVSSLTSIQDLMEVGNLLNAKGVIHQAQAAIINFNGKAGSLALSFRGGKEALTKFLRELTGQSVGGAGVLQVNPENPTDMLLMVVDPASANTKRPNQG